MTKADFKRLREKAGTQAAVAAAMRVHVGAIAKWETGERAIPEARAEEIRRLAQNPPMATSSGETVRSIAIESTGRGLKLIVTDSTGERTITAPAESAFRITGSTIEIVPKGDPK